MLISLVIFHIRYLIAINCNKISTDFARVLSDTQNNITVRNTGVMYLPVNRMKEIIKIFAQTYNRH